MFKNGTKFGVCLIVLLSFVFLTTMAFGQSGASLSGTVQDASGGVLVGVNLGVRNVDTGVEARTTSNDRGIYNFPSLQPGSYEITVEAAGFSRDARSVRLNAGAQGTLNFNLTVAGTVTEIAVSGTVESVILEAGSSTGTVMQEEALQALPLVGNNVMDLLVSLGAVTPASDPVFGAQSQQFAGTTSINITRDGVSVNEVRHPSGITGNTNINSEMIGEFKMVLSAVDAEMGRGAGQVQMTTRSGSNAFHGSAIWNNQNTALDARDWSAKRNNVPMSWRNVNSYILTGSGPIIKNKTFFFATWEQQFSRDRLLANIKTLTPCARKGIYRYIAGWIPGVRGDFDTFNSQTGVRTSVDPNGRPLESGMFYNGRDLTAAPEQFGGHLQIRSVFGELESTFARDLLADKSENGVYGDCSSLPFQPGTLGGLDTRNFYGANTIVPGSYWGGDDFTTGGGVYRHAYDPTGFVDRFTFGADYSAGRVVMPDVNNYDIGDGLNHAGWRYYAPLRGSGGTIYGTGGDPDRKSITVKIDHNVSANHRLSGTYTHESFFIGDYDGTGQRSHWPEEFGGYNGVVERSPKNLAITFTSMLRPTLLNEARFGLSHGEAWTQGPMYGRTADQMREVLEKLMPPDKTLGRQLVVSVGTGAMNFSPDTRNQAGADRGSHPLGTRGAWPIKWGGPDARWTVSDTITWMKGSHSFKGGAEWRRMTSKQDYEGMRGFANSGAFIDTPSAFGGLTGDASAGGVMRQNAMLGRTMSWSDVFSPYNTVTNTGLSNPATGTGNYAIPRAMMAYFSGAINELRQYYYRFYDPSICSADNPTCTRWNNAANAGEGVYSMDMAAQEFAFFFKDDWKVTNNLTLNLGIRYEYYGVPWERNGYTIRAVGDVFDSAMGLTKGGWDHWMTNRNYVAAGAAAMTIDPVTNRPILTSRPTPLPPETMFEYVGPNSVNPDKSIWDKDLNNFGPHIGFAYQLPWFGKDQTTLRGGWSLSYNQIDNFNQYGIYVADAYAAAVSQMRRFVGEGDASEFGATNYYMDLTDLNIADKVLNRNGLLPDPSVEGINPLRPYAVGSLTSGGGNLVDNNIRNPYVHSLNMSLTRNIGRNLTFDVRYIGTLGRDRITSPVSLNVNQANYIQNGLYSEFEKIRRDIGYQSDLINSLIPRGAYYAPGGNYTLTGTDQIRYYGSGTAQNLAFGNFSGVAGSLFGATDGTFAQWPGMPTNSGLLSRAGCLPEDREKPNGDMADHVGNSCLNGTPWNYNQANPQYASLNIFYNAPITNYHSMQTQVTLRPTRGLSLQATWTWSRNLETSSWTDYTQDYRDGRDYLLSSQHRSHNLNTYGSYELPFGANGFFFRDVSGVLKKAIEGWQIHWITSMSSGTPINVTAAQSTLWNRSWPILVRPDLWNEKSGKIVWNDVSDPDGSYFGDRYTRVPDLVLCDSNNLAGGLGGYCTPANTPRALALADPSQSDGVAKYTHDYLGADGVTYRAGTPVIVFRNPSQADGSNASGNYKPGRVTGPGRLSFDMAASKSIEFMEGKRFEIRVDAQNILNHPTPTGSANPSSYYSGRFTTTAAPGLSIGGTTGFGRLLSKTGHRTFQARLSLRF